MISSIKQKHKKRVEKRLLIKQGVVNTQQKQWEIIALEQLTFKVSVRGVVTNAIDHSQVLNGRLCRVVVTDLGEFALAITIGDRGLLGCVVALHIAERYIERFTVTLCSEKLSHYAQRIPEDPRRSRPHSSSHFAD